MERELRDVFESDRRRGRTMPEGHEERFEKRLRETPVHSKRLRFRQVGIAASWLLILGLGYLWYTSEKDRIQRVSQTSVAPNPSVLTLGKLSPDLLKVETYYDAAINLELARLDITPENQQLAADFIGRLEELDGEYRILSQELNEIGPNEDTITAMIRNLQLRLQVLQDLSLKLNTFKLSKNERNNKNA